MVEHKLDDTDFVNKLRELPREVTVSVTIGFLLDRLAEEQKPTRVPSLSSEEWSGGEG